MLVKKNIQESFSKFDDVWSPHIAGEINDSYLKLAKLDGEFVWHKHDNEDELFLVVEGILTMELRDQDPVILHPGEFLVVPKGVEHKPVAQVPTKIILLEPKTTLNTGDATDSRTIHDLPYV